MKRGLTCCAKRCGQLATHVAANYGNKSPAREGGWTGEAWCAKHAPKSAKLDPGPVSR